MKNNGKARHDRSKVREIHWKIYPKVSHDAGAAHGTHERISGLAPSTQILRRLCSARKWLQSRFCHLYSRAVRVYLLNHTNIVLSFILST